MTDNPQPQPGIYLIVEFDWPDNVTKEQAGNAYRLHQVVRDKEWIRGVVAGSGGIGGAQSSIWIFWLESYAALGRLLRDQEDEVGQVYNAFFKEMPNVVDRVREEVVVT